MIPFDVSKIFDAKNWREWALTLLLLFLAYKVYNFIYDRGEAAGVASQAALVDNLTNERNAAVASEADYRATYTKWMDETAEAKRRYTDEMMASKRKLENQLADAERRASQKQEIIREVTKYIPASSDAQYRLPVGFVRMYSDSLQGPAATDASLGVLPGGASQALGEASAFALSNFGSNAAWNNMECVQRGVIIAAWQKWYEDAKTAYDLQMQVQFDTAPSK